MQNNEKKRVIKAMIQYHKTAFTHGVSKADIEWAIKTTIFERPKKERRYG
jgi:hypothetical protein